MFTKCNQRNEGKGNKKALEEINKTHCVMHSKLWGIYTIFLLSIMELTSDSKKLTLSTHSSNILLRLVSVFLNQTLPTFTKFDRSPFWFMWHYQSNGIMILSERFSKHEDEIQQKKIHETKICNIAENESL